MGFVLLIPLISALNLRGEKNDISLGIEIGESLAKSIEEAFNGDDDYNAPESNYSHLKNAILAEFKPIANKDMAETVRSNKNTPDDYKKHLEEYFASELIPGAQTIENYSGPGGPIVGF